MNVRVNARGTHVHIVQPDEEECLVHELLGMLKSDNSEGYRQAMLKLVGIMTGYKQGLAAKWSSAAHRMMEVTKLLKQHPTFEVAHPLHAAVRHSAGNIICAMTDLGFNVNDVDDSGMTALSVGARIANAPMVNVLLKKRASVHTHDDHGATPLHHAAFAGDVKVIEMLVHANAEISDGDSQGLTPLHIAVSRGHRESVLKLIELGADVNCASRNGFTPLHCAVNKSHADIVDDLIERGAKVKTGQKANNLALVAAAAYSDVPYKVAQATFKRGPTTRKRCAPKLSAATA